MAEYLSSHPLTAQDDRESGAGLPVLTKLIDAKEPLSIQVHPNDAYALQTAGEGGKTELWHILSADPGAFLYLGVRRETTPGELAAAIREQRVEELLNKIPVHAGESYYIPAGTLHAIGGGILLYEVQQSSNLTYRVYDYGRVDAAGRPRQLHIADALAVARVKPTDCTPPGSTLAVPWGDGCRRTIAACPYFTLEEAVLAGNGRIAAGTGDFCHVFLAEGAASARQPGAELALPRGGGLFLPGGEEAQLRGNARLLLTRASRGRAKAV